VRRHRDDVVRAAAPAGRRVHQPRRQTLAVVTNRTPGLVGGVSFSARRFGVRIALEWMRRRVAGRNGPYTFALTYTSREPLDDRPQSVDVQRSVAWADTTGSIDQVGMDVSVAYRIGSAGRGHLTVFGGPTFSRLSGRVEALGFTTFHLGGHSVLFEDDYRVAVDLSPADVVGMTLGGDGSLPLSRRTALVIGARYLATKSVDSVATPSTILNAGDLSLAEPLAAIAEAMTPIRVRLNAAGLRVVAGVSLRP
jgi:hypothetical protein